MSWQVERLDLGKIWLDGGAMFGIIPKPLWSKQIPADSANRIPLNMSCMLLRRPGKLVLVESGMGLDFDQKRREIYGVTDLRDMRQVLANHGVNPDQITDVILTHLHFDHADGLVDEKNHPLFRNAVHYVQQKQLDWARRPSARDGGSYRPAALAAFNDPKIRHHCVDGEVELMEGIRVTLAHGHTPFLQAVHVDSSLGKIVFVADLIPTSAHVNLPAVMGYDLNALQSVTEKEAFLKQAVAQKWWLWYYHDPRILLSQVEFDGKRYHPVNGREAL